MIGLLRTRLSALGHFENIFVSTARDGLASVVA